MTLAVVHDLRPRQPATAEDVAAFEVDVVAGLMLARSAAGIGDKTIRQDVANLEQARAWFGRPLWEMEPADGDAYFGRALRNAANSTKGHKAKALTVYFDYLNLRHRAEVFALCGRAPQCPLDEMNRPRNHHEMALRIPPSEREILGFFAGWREELGSCRKYAPSARTFCACRLISQVGLRINETCGLDLDDVKWDLGHFGKLHVRFGKGANRSGPRPRMAPLINGADATLRWFIEDIWGLLDTDDLRPGAPLFPSERRHPDGTARRITDDGIRCGLAEAVARHLPGWQGRLTPHALRH
jgi:integrase